MSPWRSPLPRPGLRCNRSSHYNTGPRRDLPGSNSPPVRRPGPDRPARPSTQPPRQPSESASRMFSYPRLHSPRGQMRPFLPGPVPGFCIIFLSQSIPQTLSSWKTSLSVSACILTSHGPENVHTSGTCSRRDAKRKFRLTISIHAHTIVVCAIIVRAIHTPHHRRERLLRKENHS